MSEVVHNPASGVQQKEVRKTRFIRGPRTPVAEQDPGERV